MKDIQHWLALHHALHGTPTIIIKLLKHHTTPQNILKLNPQQLPITQKQMQRLKTINYKQIEQELKWAELPQHHIININHCDYPCYLKETYDPPIILYAIGNIKLLNTLQIAIVGSRKPTHSGQQTATTFAQELSQENLTITSGMALGIDGCAHRGALTKNKPTIAVLGCGVNQIYPRSHKSLYQQIQQHGLILSEYPLHTKPVAENFPKRNRIISGLAKATIVIEATLRSGSLITARFANEQGRDVFAIPGSIYSPQSRGCHHLIKQGAIMAETVQDILDELNMRQTLETTKKDTIYSNELDQMDTELIECVGFETRSVQYLIENCSIPAQHVVTRLLKLELRGYIKAVPGGYCRVKL
jgi:DNA processing protein